MGNQGAIGDKGDPRVRIEQAHFADENVLDLSSEKQMDAPLVSVIIPTRNRAAMLRQLMETLARQSLPPDRFEVVVVDDGSSDETPQVAQGRYPFAVCYCQEGHQGGAMARNTGAGASRGALLVFVDDDMLLEPDYLAGLVKEHQAQARVIVMGELLPHLTPEDTVFRSIYTRLTASSAYNTGNPSFASFASNNFSIKREHFFALGMWQKVADDPRTLWLDVDLTYRAYKQGFAFRSSPDAHCYHRDYAIRDLDTFTRRYRFQASLAVSLFRKYPDLAPLLPMFRDKGYVQWGEDSPSLIAKKIVRQVLAAWPVLPGLEMVTHLFERVYPQPQVLAPLYRWVIGGYIAQGYRMGLRGETPKE
ncbi:MAG: glycosyltransferase family 2 protein [Anaerolineae bacterium]